MSTTFSYGSASVYRSVAITLLCLTTLEERLKRLKKKVQVADDVSKSRVSYRSPATRSAGVVATFLIAVMYPLWITILFRETLTFSFITNPPSSTTSNKRNKALGLADNPNNCNMAAVQRNDRPDLDAPMLMTLPAILQNPKSRTQAQVDSYAAQQRERAQALARKHAEDKYGDRASGVDRRKGEGKRSLRRRENGMFLFGRMRSEH